VNETMNGGGGGGGAARTRDNAAYASPRLSVGLFVCPFIRLLMLCCPR